MCLIPIQRLSTTFESHNKSRDYLIINQKKIHFKRWKLIIKSIYINKEKEEIDKINKINTKETNFKRLE